MQSYIEHLESLSKKQLMVMLARQRQAELQGIAIVGMGCRFPGGIDNPRRFWKAICETDLTDDKTSTSPVFSDGSPRWNLQAKDLAPMATLLHPGRYIDNLDVFDAEYFDIQEEETAYMDPQQRLLSEVVVQALADANITRKQLQRKTVGIYVGMSSVEYTHAGIRNCAKEGIDASELSAHLLNGSSLSAASGRLGMMLGVSGPALTLDTASSSALTGIHLAMQALRKGECDIAIVGASHLQMSPVTNAVLAKAGLVSESGKSLPFTNSADGFVRAEGCGVVVLKRSKDAVNDLSYAAIRGSSIHQHGDRIGLSVASANGQRRVVREALKNANIESNEVQFVEAQSNGIRIGAAIEVEALAAAYQRDSAEKQPLYLGSCKAHLGYMEIASGIAGLMKVALSLAHKKIPPQIGSDDLDTRIPWDSMSFRFANQAITWPEAKRQLAGVSAFGVNGINAHVIVEGNASGSNQAVVSHTAADEPALLALSANVDTNFVATAKSLLAFLESSNDWDYHAVCRTLLKGREPLAVRRAAVVSSRDALVNTLSEWAASNAESSTEHASAASSSAENNYLSLKIPATDSTEFKNAIATLDQTGLEYVRSIFENNLETMALPAFDKLMSDPDQINEGVHLAWVHSWISAFNSHGVQLGSVEMHGSCNESILNVIAEPEVKSTVLAAWTPSKALSTSQRTIGSPWELIQEGSNYRAMHKKRTVTLSDLPLHEMDGFHWLSLLADRFQSGLLSSLDELVSPEMGPLLHLPGPVLVGQSNWPKMFRWY